VEDQRQLECLYQLGCRVVQGYLFSPPVPAEQLTALLDQSWHREYATA
jgi:EAL domain-containing protein (putative c-di-GMP-specific phosphodiesterase class I)